MAAPAPEEAARWSGSRPVTGRDEIFDPIMTAAHAAFHESGRAAFLLGPAGSGKTVFLELLEDQINRRYSRTRMAEIDCGGVREGVSIWIELARTLTFRHRLRESLWNVFPDWVQTLPIAGDLFSAIGETVKALRTGRVPARKPRHVEFETATPLRAMQSLFEHHPREHRVIMLDGLERATPEDLAGASAFLRQIDRTRTFLVATVTTTNGRPDAAVRDLIVETERYQRGQSHILDNLSAAEVAEVVGEATGGTLPEAWRDWLLAASGGHPRTLWDVVGRLEADGLLQRSERSWSWADTPPGDPLAAARTPPLPELQAEDRHLLACAAAEGVLFHSAILAGLAGIDELDLEDRLAALARTGILQFRDAPPQIAEITSIYAFRHPGHATTLLAELPDEERLRLTRRARELGNDLSLPPTTD